MTFATPHRALVVKKEVKRVTVPGRDGAMGIEKNSPPMLTELKPGLVRVDFNDSTPSEEFFVPGGFAFKHANNVMDVSAPEGVKLDSIDADALRAANAEAVKALAAATAGSKAAAEAKIQLEVFKVRPLQPRRAPWHCRPCVALFARPAPGAPLSRTRTPSPSPPASLLSLTSSGSWCRAQGKPVRTFI